MSKKDQGKNRAQRARAFARPKGPESAAARDAQGRVHLVFHRDPTSGEERLQLSGPIFKEAWQNEVAGAAANTACDLLQGEPNLARTVALARNAMAATSRLAEGLLAQAPAGSVACRAGCAHCCYQSVGVTPPEALAIFDYLQHSRSPSELASLSAQVAARNAQTSGLSASERFSPDHPCPFLQVELGHCSIYEVRPLACRGMNSLDAGECETRLRDPAARAAFLAAGRGGRSFMEPIRAFHAVSAGLQVGVADLYELDMRPLELTAALHILLSAPEAAPQAWLSGETPFEAALRSDSANDPGLHEVSGALGFSGKPPTP
jgi:Fe-S-cluster containining protein